MMNWITVVISSLALLISILTAWLTLLRRGELRMTQPTVVYLGPDGGLPEEGKPCLKVFVRTLLFSTSQRGQTVESLHVSLQRGESKQSFPIWVYGDKELVRGSGLFVPFGGIACNHHFLLPADGTDFKLLPGAYTLRIYAKRISDSAPLQIGSIELSISEKHASDLQADNAGIYFDWGPDRKAYYAHIRIQKPQSIPKWISEIAG